MYYERMVLNGTLSEIKDLGTLYFEKIISIIISSARLFASSLSFILFEE